MRARTLAIASVGLALAATPAAAQHCGPTAVALIVKDARGAVVDPRPLIDSIQYSPGRDEDADFMVRVVLIHPNERGRWNQPGGIPAITWYGQADCRVDMREVVLRRGPVVMRLWMDLHLNSLRTHAPTSYVLESPPFASGTWRLDVCAVPEGDQDRYVPIPTRWTRVSTSGNPGIPWQPPRGCGAAR